MQFGVMQKILQAILALALFSMCPPVMAQTLKHYDLLLDDKKIGGVTMKTDDLAQGGRKVTQFLRIKTGGFWGKIDIRGTLEERISASGQLLEASNELKENKKVFWSKLQLSGEEYLSFRSQMKDKGEKDMDELKDLATGVATFLVPEVGDVIEIGTLLLSDDKNSPRNDRLTASSFDTSLVGLPFYWQRNAFRLPGNLRIFDTQDMVILMAKVEDLGTEHLVSGTKQIPARHYRLKVKGTDPIDVWLFRSADGHAYFAKLTGKEDGSLFQVCLQAGQQ
ncbi:DUF6134 family protein [Labrenzia sp. VG12]|uniref:DUF6134 family protein n=1 Tax=Labrenzia sp. VG12 TaxID=2021862 RepID=UPI0012FD8ADD|nr:DUF6134 family protein [Labrenzia sp. VG12]